ncbi:PREDICTED: tctex1 domain-containing protein 2 [Drosophila arizonae]|uniref:Tctex1 domain-containing protein 2 n=1 Tax=Drosophila arizonae TaxID=7263 RepID=A0ABM1PDJ0_DROAR|nr:PREDICTED: tctex1 domain-containing protein 2 [Drosophila arizonae]
MSDEKKSMNIKKVERSVPKNASNTASQHKTQTQSASAQLSADAEMEEEAVGQPAAYSMRPEFGESFPLPIVKNIINSTMATKLKDKIYDKDIAKIWTREIADEVNQQIAASPKVKRYKHVVQVMLGQELGAGSTYLSRCCWDCDCDTSVTEVFTNTSLFCVCTVFATYQY